jgi:hypothetical protein
MLRCARSRIELPYIPVQGALRHGMRPPRLEKKILYMPRRSPDDSCNTPGLPLAAFHRSRRRSRFVLRRIRRRGVGTGGGAIDFVKLMQTVDFQQATEFLRRYGNIAQLKKNRL